MAEWDPFMYLGNVHYMSYPLTMTGGGDALATIRATLEDDYFTAIEITWIREPEARRKVAEMLRYAGVPTVFSAGPPYIHERIDISSLDEGERTRSLAMARLLIDEAYYFGARMHLLIAGRDPGAAARERGRAIAVESLESLCAYAEAKATGYVLTLCLEPVDRTIVRRGLLGPTVEAADVARQVRQRRPNFGLTVDLSHTAELGEDPAETVARVKDVMVHTHLANCYVADPSHPMYGDEHPWFGYPGGAHSSEHVRAYFEALLREGFFCARYPYGKPIVSTEVKPHGDESPSVVIAATKRAVREAWAGIPRALIEAAAAPEAVPMGE